MGKKATDGLLQADDHDPIIWGGVAIARVLNTTPRRAFYLLEKGLIPATKVGGTWAGRRSALLSIVPTARGA